MSDASAKKRSIFRLRNIVLVVILGLVVWAGVFTVYLATLTPGVSGKFKGELAAMEEEAQRATAGEPNGWQAFVDVTELHGKQMTRLQEAAKPADWPEAIYWPPAVSDAWNPNMTPGARATLRAFVKTCEGEGLLDKLDAVVAGKRFVRPLSQASDVDVLFPSLGPTRGLARFCAGRMYFAAIDHDRKEFVRSARHALAVASVCKKQFSTITQLTGGSVDCMVAVTLRDAIRDGVIDVETCREMLALLNSSYEPYDPVIGFKSDRISAKEAVEISFSDDGHGDGRMIPAVARMFGSGKAEEDVSGLQGLKAKAGILFGPTKKQTLEAFDRFFTLAEAEAALPMRARLNGEGGSANAYVATLDKTYVVVHMMAPAAGGQINLSAGCDLEVAGAKVMLALELHRAAHGSYPESLATLEPSLATLNLKTVWREEFRLGHLTKRADAAGRPYLLYWIGIDGKDDGGRVLEDGTNQAPFANGARGYDFVLNLPPAKAKKPEEAPPQ